MNPTVQERAAKSFQDRHALIAVAVDFAKKMYGVGFEAGYAEACFQLAALEQNAETANDSRPKRISGSDSGRLEISQ